MGRQPLRGGRIDWRTMRAQAEAVFKRLGLSLPLNARLGDLGKARAQLVEITKVMTQDARILILDEPTAALTQQDVKKLFGTLAGLQAQGVSMIYISHRLEEIFEVAGRVTVLRDGEAVGLGRTLGLPGLADAHHRAGRLGFARADPLGQKRLRARLEPRSRALSRHPCALGGAKRLRLARCADRCRGDGLRHPLYHYPVEHRQRLRVSGDHHRRRRHQHLRRFRNTAGHPLI